MTRYNQDGWWPGFAGVVEGSHFLAVMYRMKGKQPSEEQEGEKALWQRKTWLREQQTGSISCWNQRKEMGGGGAAGHEVREKGKEIRTERATEGAWILCSLDNEKPQSQHQGFGKRNALEVLSRGMTHFSFKTMTLT